MLGLDRLKLDGDLFARDDIGAKVDVTERTRTDLASNSVLVANTKILGSMLAECLTGEDSNADGVRGEQSNACQEWRLNRARRCHLGLTAHVIEIARAIV